jgi:hypothetical protein
MDMRSVVEANIRRCFEDLDCLAIKTIDSPAELAGVRRDIEKLSRTLGLAAQKTLARIEEQEAFRKANNCHASDSMMTDPEANR